MRDREDAELSAGPEPPLWRHVVRTLLVWGVVCALAGMAVACFLWPFVVRGAARQ